MFSEGSIWPVFVQPNFQLVQRVFGSCVRCLFFDFLLLPSQSSKILFLRPIGGWSWDGKVERFWPKKKGTRMAGNPIQKRAKIASLARSATCALVWFLLSFVLLFFFIFMFFVFFMLLSAVLLFFLLLLLLLLLLLFSSSLLSSSSSFFLLLLLLLLLLLFPSSHRLSQHPLLTTCALQETKAVLCSSCLFCFGFLFGLQDSAIFTQISELVCNYLLWFACLLSLQHFFGNNLNTSLCTSFVVLFFVAITFQ